jgi:regulator of replication initiation timing
MEILVILAVALIVFALSAWTYLLYRQTNNTDADVVNFVLSTQVVSLQNENNNLKIENNILKNRVEILEEIENV